MRFYTSIFANSKIGSVMRYGEEGPGPKGWEKLSAGGEIVRCGWLKDKYGLSWQIVPTVLGHFGRVATA
jgi:predicted 3-demethylubiquinone-9 3-methyltransferase (glyoxalase superfamily)